MRKLIILGAGETAQVMYEYFNYDSDYAITAFSVESRFIKETTLNGLPVIPFEHVQNEYAPEEYYFFTAISYTKLNRARTRLYKEAKSKGYAPASYISKNALVLPRAHLGEHIFIFENNVVQPFAEIGNNVILWSGNHIGHRAVIRDNCFISSHVVISGFASVGENSFVGVNASIADHVSVGKDCFIGAGSVISKNLLQNSVTKPQQCKSADGAKILFGLGE